jgi:hypothetical protein
VVRQTTTAPNATRLRKFFDVDEGNFSATHIDSSQLGVAVVERPDGIKSQLISSFPESTGDWVEEKNWKWLKTVEYKRARFSVARLRLDLPVSCGMKPNRLRDRMRPAIGRGMSLVANTPIECSDARIGGRQLERRP